MCAFIEYFPHNKNRFTVSNSLLLRNKIIICAFIGYFLPNEKNPAAGRSKNNRW